MQNILLLRQTFSSLKNSVFLRNVFIIMSGTGIAQLLGLCMSPIISRLYTPDDFGMFGNFNAVFMVIAAGATLDYGQAIMLPEKRYDALHLFYVSCAATCFMSFFCSIICIFFPTFVLSLIKSDSLWLLPLLIFAVLVTGMNISLQSWAIRIKSFKHTSGSNVARSISNNSSQVMFGFLKYGPFGLIISNIIGDAMGSINVLFLFLKDTKSSFKTIRFRKLLSMAKSYYDFPLYSASQNMINAVSAGVPVILLTHFFSVSIAGYYAFSIRIMRKPMSLITGSIRQVLFQRACEIKQSNKTICSLYVKSTVGLFLLGLIPSLLLVLWGPYLYSLVFGEQWLNAGHYARWIILWMLFVFCNVPAVLFARIIRIQHVIFIYDLGLLAARVMTLIIGGFYLTAIECVAVYSILGAVMNSFLIALVGYKIMKNEGKLSLDYLKSFMNNIRTD